MVMVLVTCTSSKVIIGLEPCFVLYSSKDINDGKLRCVLVRSKDSSDVKLWCVLDINYHHTVSLGQKNFLSNFFTFRLCFDVSAPFRFIMSNQSDPSHLISPSNFDKWPILARSEGRNARGFFPKKKYFDKEQMWIRAKTLTNESVVNGRDRIQPAREIHLSPVIAHPPITFSPDLTY